MFLASFWLLLLAVFPLEIRQVSFGFAGARKNVCGFLLILQ